MRLSSLLGLSVGWLLTSLAMAFDVGREDVIFFPVLALAAPAVFGLVMGVRDYRKATPPEVFSVGRFIAFGLVGVVLMTLATLAVIAAIYWGEPLPQT